MQSAVEHHLAVVGADVVVRPDDRAAHEDTGDEYGDHGESDAAENPFAPRVCLRRFGFGGSDGRPPGRLGRRAQRRRTTGRGPRIGDVLLIVASGRSADDWLAVAVIHIDDVGDHDGDVVGPTATQGQLDEPVGAVTVVLHRRHGVGDGLFADHVGQAVAAQKVAVAGAGLAHRERGLDLGAGERTHDQRPLRMCVCFFGRDPTFFDKGLNERVVAGDLGELAVAQQIAARVADVAQTQARAREEDGGEGGAHAIEFGGLGHLVGDRLVAMASGLFEFREEVAAGLVVVEGT